MFGIDDLIAFACTPLGKVVFSFVLNELVKIGAVDAAEKLAIKILWTVYTDLKGVKTFYAPDDFPHEGKPLGTSMCNLKTTSGTPVNEDAIDGDHIPTEGNQVT